MNQCQNTSLILTTHKWKYTTFCNLRIYGLREIFINKKRSFKSLIDSLYKNYSFRTYYDYI